MDQNPQRDRTRGRRNTTPSARRQPDRDRNHSRRVLLLGLYSDNGVYDMDINCRYCGEPWDNDSLHDMQAPDAQPAAPDYRAAVLAHCSGSELAVGVAADCRNCPDHDPDDDDSRQAAEDPSFRRGPCDSCGTSLGGDYFAAHSVENSILAAGLKPRKVVLHWDICADCVQYWANGEEPDDWTDGRRLADPEPALYSYYDALARFCRLGCGAFDDPSPDAAPCSHAATMDPERLALYGIAADLCGDDGDALASDCSSSDAILDVAGRRA